MLAVTSAPVDLLLAAVLFAYVVYGLWQIRAGR
jgi:hypothetical protein